MRIVASPRVRLAMLALAVLVVLLMQLPGMAGEARDGARFLSSWNDRERQYRETLERVPYDLLREADAALPDDARVLLVTPGADVRHREYTMFHRALYFLAPRHVSWITPAPGDGTWEARWWRTAAATATSICAEAGRAASTHLLLLDVAPERAPRCDPAVAAIGMPAGTLVAVSATGVAAASAPPSIDAGPPVAWPLLLALALAVPIALGIALLSVLFRTRGLGLAPWHRLSLAWALGAGLVTLAEALLGAVGVPPLGRRAVLTAAAALAGAAVVLAYVRGTRREAGPPRAPGREPPGPWSGRLLSLGFGAIIAAEIALVALVSMGRPLWAWDAWAHWGLKARTLFAEGRVTPMLYADPAKGSTNLDHPLQVPLLEAWVFGWLGEPDDRLVGSIGLVTFVALLGLCYGALRARGAAMPVALGVTAIAGALAPLRGLAGAGFADLPLALLLLAATVHFATWLERGDRADLVVAALAAGLLGWTKKEGLVLAGVLTLVALAGVLLHRRDGTARRRGFAAAISLPLAVATICGPWYAFVAHERIPDVVYRTSIATLVENLGRVPTIVSMQLSMLAWPAWSFVWPVAAAVAAVAVTGAVAARRRRPHGTGWVLAITAAAWLVAGSAAYLFTTFEPYTEQIESSGFRLAAQALPLVLVWLGATVFAPRPRGAVPA